MSIVKDFLLISIFIFFIVKYFNLYIKMIKERNYFIDTLSHDLKVAIIAQIRAIDLLKKQPTSNTNYDLTKSLEDSGKYSLELINMLLNSYKYENNEQILKFEYFNINELISNTYEHISSIASEKNITLIYENKTSNVIYADKTEFFKALLILLTTSIDYAQKNSLISTKIKKVNKNINLEVTYIGHSLNEEEYKRMFFKKPRFSTVGHGIKMHLCKKIIDFHNGNIKIESNNSKNSFIISIPDANLHKKNQTQTNRKLQACFCGINNKCFLNNLHN